MRHRAGSSAIRHVVEIERGSDVLPALVHPEWVHLFPWLVQGTTTRGHAPRPFDLRLFSGGRPQSEVRDNWRVLARDLGATRVVHSQQPHGSVVRVWPGEEGSESAETDPDRRDGVLTLVDPCDGHVTDRPGVLVAATVADCVPVFMVDPHRRVVAVVHAGWRGTAAGILEGAVEAMARRFDSETESLHVHLGPAICGTCYEVGPEVHHALNEPVPERPMSIDLRAILARRAGAAGVVGERVTASAHCTLCGDAGLFSHRGGDESRQVGYLGLRTR